MGRLLLNTRLYEHLKLRIKFSLLLLPFTLMFGFPLFLFSLSDALIELLDASSYFVPYLILMAASGFYLGWRCNRFVAKRLLKWNDKVLYQVFSVSEVPMQWYKKDGFNNYKTELKEELDTLSEQSSDIASCLHKGLKSGLLCYILFNLIIVVLNPLIEGRDITKWSFFLWPSPLIALGFGILISVLHRYAVNQNEKEKEYFETSYYFNLDEAVSHPYQVERAKGIDAILAKANLIVGILVCCAICSLGVFLVKSALVDDPNAVPAKSELQIIHGRLSSISESEEHINFNLDTTETVFSYPKRAGKYDTILRQLNDNTGQELSALFTPLSGATKTIHTVYELKLDNQDLRSYEESKRTLQIWWFLTVILALLFIAFGAFGIFGTWLEYKSNRDF